MLELSRELIDQIIFGMENQDHDYLLDLETGELVDAQEQGDEAEYSPERYEPVPGWTSVDGYNLMERFVLGLHNPIYRERLRQILASGRGVFRHFKDAVRERRDIERLWFTFKEREMRRIVGEWYNDIREARGLERLESLSLEEDLEQDALVLSDFVVTNPGRESLELLDEMDRAAFDEIHHDEPEDVRDILYREERRAVPDLLGDGSFLTVIETPAGEIAGYIHLIRENRPDRSRAVLRRLYVRPEYRGVGLARVLLHDMLPRLVADGLADLRVTLSGSAFVLQEAFENEGFSPVAATLSLDLARWIRESRDE